MGKRKIIIKQSVAESIARTSWFIESKGLVATAERFSNAIYDFIENIADDKRTSAICRDPLRAALGYKCVQFRKTYTVVFLESETEITICEFLPSKMIKW